MHRSHAIALAVVVAAPFIAPRAEACTVRLYAPADIRFSFDGATLPANAALIGSGFTGGLADGSSWWLIADDDTTIALTMTQLGVDATRFTPATALAPSTTYTLKWSPTADAPTDTSADDVLGDGGEVRAVTVVFQTGTDVDVTAPAAPTATSETHGVWAGDLAGCGIEDGTLARFFVDGDDVDDVVLWQLRDEDGAVVDSRFVGATGEPVLRHLRVEGGRHTYQIVAIDQAGNESETSAYEVDFGLDGSCAASGAGTPLALGAIVLAVRRRRQR